MLRFMRYCLDNIFKLNVTMAKSKVKSRSHHDNAHLHPPINVPTVYQPFIPSLWGYTPDKILQVYYRITTARLKVKLEDRSQKKKIMFLYSKNKASRKGYKGEC